MFLGSKLRPVRGTDNLTALYVNFTTLNDYIYICLEDMYSVLNCQNVAKYTEFYMG
jgi:hypothetical protein